MRAVCKIKREPHYRHDAFQKGLVRAGYQIVTGGRPQDRRDLLVVWNRHGSTDEDAKLWEAHGGTVIVCENGYIGKDTEGRQLYAMAVHGHNGSGWYPVGDEDRFGQLGIELKPWSSAPDGHLLICGQRGIGSKAMASPFHWDEKAAKALSAAGETRHRIRKHPGHVPTKTTFAQDLEGARACVIWSSTAGVQALVLGIPVVYTAPFWIASECAARGLDRVKSLVMDDARRLAALHKMAWGQRTVEEIESGEPFTTFRDRRAEAKW